MGDVIRINDDTQGFRNVRGVVVGFDNETEEVMFRIIAKGYITKIFPIISLELNPIKGILKNFSPTNAIIHKSNTNKREYPSYLLEYNNDVDCNMYPK
jgi:hypothetical protein